MTDSQKNSFLAVAEYHSFSRAAAALYVSQPAISKNISTLEAEIGTPLFSRQGKYINLTKAGEIFLNFLVSYQMEFDTMLERIKSLDRGKYSGTVRIGCDMTWNAAHFYSRLARHFSIHYPDIQIEVEGLGPESFLPALRRRDIDVAVMYGRDLDRQADIESEPLTSIKHGFIFSSIISGSRETSLDELADIPFLYASDPADRRNSEQYKNIISEICRAHGFKPELKMCKSYASSFVDVSCGRGVLLVDEWTAVKSNPEYCYIPTDVAVPVCVAHLATAPDSLLSLFISEARKVFGGNY